jgi:hypothetical protein
MSKKPGDQAGQPADHLQVNAGDLLDIGVLHFYYHLGAVRQLGAVGLPDGSSGQGCLVEAGEKFFRCFAKFLHDPPAHFFVRPRRIRSCSSSSGF